jgi:hypothetical protein
MSDHSYYVSFIDTYKHFTWHYLWSINQMCLMFSYVSKYMLSAYSSIKSYMFSLIWGGWASIATSTHSFRNLALCIMCLVHTHISRTVLQNGVAKGRWWGSIPAMPMFRAFDSWSVCGRLADSTVSDRNRTHTGVYPGSTPQRVKTYILLVWSCIACIVGAITMVHRWWNLAEVEEDGMASLCTWDLCEIRCLCEIRRSPFLAAPPRP